MSLTLFDQIWNSHIVTQSPGHPAVLYIDLHLLHEVTSPQAFAELRSRGLPVRRLDRTLATMDHSIPTIPGGEVVDAAAAQQLEQLEVNCRDFGVRLLGRGSERSGIVHVIGPELGLTQPGMTIVCGDSHTATHGAFGALAFGIGSSEVAHVLATQCLLQHRPSPLEVRIDGQLGEGVGAKDIILALIAKIGTGGGTGHVLEYTGSAIRGLDMEGRMTVCNMSIEAGARAGMVAPDDTTFDYLAGRELAPRGAEWDAALARWRELGTKNPAGFSGRVTLDADGLEPMITYGTNPAMAVPITAPVPRPEEAPSASEQKARSKALDYMEVEPGRPLLGKHVDVVFIGSCTNSRLSDLTQMAGVLRGRKVAEGVRLLVVPGSRRVKREAEAAGIDRVVRDAGGEWREPGCSMCIAMNGDELRPGEYAVSTSNRNFEGRQGKGSRTFLASPLTAAACAVTGQVTDVRTLMEA
jgi:3-isopropylmalate/(R)-2-methylmalate dehydratase large subunit